MAIALIIFWSFVITFSTTVAVAVYFIDRDTRKIMKRLNEDTEE